MTIPTVSYDATAKAMYIQLADGETARTIELSATTYLDLDADGNPIGLEILNSSGPLQSAFHDVSAVASMHDLLLTVSS